MTEVIEIEIPDNEWMTTNDRYSTFPAAARTKLLRHRAWAIAKSMRLHCSEPVDVTVLVAFRTGGRADADNVEPTVKAILDGFTDAGVWPDDNEKHVLSTRYERGPNWKRPGWRALTLTLQSRKAGTR